MLGFFLWGCEDCGVVRIVGLWGCWVVRIVGLWGVKIAGCAEGLSGCEDWGFLIFSALFVFFLILVVDYIYMYYFICVDKV